MIISKNSLAVVYKNLYDEVVRKICIPLFQRLYAWKGEHVESLIEDILALVYESEEARKLKELHLLDFIWYDEEGVMCIADGQQRLITIKILIDCINDYIIEHSLNIPLLNNFDIYYEDDAAQAKYETYNSGKRATSPFANVYKHFYKFIDDYQGYLGEIIDVVKNSIHVNFKQASDIDSAFAIFSQINSGGKPLTKDEIIKTSITQHSEKYGISMDDFSIKDIKNLIISYHKSLETKSSGNFNNLAIMSFMKKYITKDSQSFKNFYNYMVMVRDVNKYPIFNVIKYLNKPQLLSVLYIMGMHDIDVSSQSEYLEKVLLPMCLLSVIWKIQKTNPGGVSQTLFSKVISAVKEGKKARELESIIIEFFNENKEICKINFNAFAKSLGNNLDFNTQKAILIMDIIHKNKSGNLNVASINVEHIFPKKPANEWIVNGWPGTSEEQADIIHSIGNYMLLSEAVNKKIQNKYIENKREEYDRIIPKDAILQTPMNTIDFDAFEKDKEEYVYRRQREIAMHIYEEFPCGKMFIEKPIEELI